MIQLKRLAILIIFSSMQFFYAQENIISSNINENLNGSLDKITEYEGKSLDTLKVKREISFSADRIVLEKNYLEDGTLNVEKQYLYNSDGTINQIKGINAQGVLRWKYTYIYDENKNLIEECSWKDEKNIEWKIVYVYQNNLLTEKTIFNADQSVNSKEKYTYDDSKNIKEKSIFYADNKLLKKFLFEYGENGKIKTEQRINETGVYEEIIYTYNEKKQCIKSTTLSNNKIIKESVEYKFTQDGYISSQVTKNSNNEITAETTYIYDLKNNIVMQQSESNILIRKITYIK